MYVIISDHTRLIINLIFYIWLKTHNHQLKHRLTIKEAFSFIFSSFVRKLK